MLPRVHQRSARQLAKRRKDTRTRGQPPKKLLKSPGVGRPGSGDPREERRSWRGFRPQTGRGVERACRRGPRGRHEAALVWTRTRCGPRPNQPRGPSAHGGAKAYRRGPLGCAATASRTIKLNLGDGAPEDKECAFHCAVEGDQKACSSLL